MNALLTNIFLLRVLFLLKHLLKYNYAYERFYSTIDKRFLSKDPVVGSIYESSRVNSYIYAGNNPIKYVDIDGRSFTCEITNNRFFKKAADLVNKVSGVVDKVGQALEPIVKPIAKTVSVINDEFNKLSVQEKVAIGVIGGVVACAMGIGVATVAATMAKSAIGGAVFGAATYGVEALVTGHFDQTELLNSMLVGAADMFMISGVALGMAGTTRFVVDRFNNFHNKYGERINDFLADESGEFRLTKGNKGKKDYRKTFFDVNPELEGKVVVHHAIEQQVLNRYETRGLFTEEEIHSYENLRGIPKEINSDLHLSKIRKEWNRFYKNNPNSTRKQIIEKKIEIDGKYGELFNPSIK